MSTAGNAAGNADVSAAGSAAVSVAVSVQRLTKRFGDVTALEQVSFEVAEHTVCGLLGRNGAGKTTAMQILTGQNWPSSGQVRVFGATPYENEKVLSEVCFVKESQRYPDVSVQVVLATAARLYQWWDQALADELLAEFGLPLRRKVRKLSRGMLSAVGIIVGLASRARLSSSTSRTSAWTRCPGSCSTTGCWPTSPSTHAPCCCPRT